MFPRAEASAAVPQRDNFALTPVLVQPHDDAFVGPEHETTGDALALAIAPGRERDGAVIGGILALQRLGARAEVERDEEGALAGAAAADVCEHVAFRLEGLE